MGRPEFITDITPEEGWEIVSKLLDEATEDIYIDPEIITAVSSRVKDKDTKKSGGKETTVNQAGNEPKE